MTQRRVEATPGIEPGYTDLQSAASPLRHVASSGRGPIPEFPSAPRLSGCVASRVPAALSVPSPASISPRDLRAARIAMSDFAAQRFNMIEAQVRTNDVTDPRIHAAMGDVAARALRARRQARPRLCRRAGRSRRRAAICSIRGPSPSCCSWRTCRPTRRVLDVGCGHRLFVRRPRAPGAIRDRAGAGRRSGPHRLRPAAVRWALPMSIVTQGALTEGLQGEGALST